MMARLLMFEISPILFPGANLRQNDFRFVSGAGRTNVWFPNG
jgi:hypothetical protein